MGDVTLEKVNFSSVHITRTYLHSTEEKTSLRGELTRRIPARGSILGHWHVELIGFDGKVMKEAEIRYKRKNVKSRYAYFSLPEALASGSTIRVTHHDMRPHFFLNRLTHLGGISILINSFRSNKRCH